jgi:hypothetical protein
MATEPFWWTVVALYVLDTRRESLGCLRNIGVVVTFPGEREEW